MFRNRTSQKPSDDLYKTFKDSFPSFKQEASSGDQHDENNGPTLTEALDIARPLLHDQSHHNNFRDAEPTPRASLEPWAFTGSGLTPSLFDPDSNGLNSFANQLPGYYTPTPGGTNTFYHSQHAGDLHTPRGFSMGLGTPLSMPTSDGTLHAASSSVNMQHFNPQSQMQHMQPSQFHNMNPFQMHNQQAFAPQDFHQSQPPPSFQHMSSHESDPSSLGEITMDLGMSNESSELLYQPNAFRQMLSPSKPMNHHMEQFRYQSTLNAPTAMIKQTGEIPITYLNKGQAYTLNVVDSAPQRSTVGQLKYRTFVRVSFEEDEQRKRPGACWQLWKEGRGTNEAHQRGGRLQAVEFVDPSQVPGFPDERYRANIELESASFDGFCVTWTPPANGSIECPIPVRFNFLSTDFSHSKGVKGIPVRLCAKTELLLDSMSPSAAQDPAYEVSYCKVKLFRDHGAERKLSNDVAHVKKTIEKLTQQLAQVESGSKDLGKRKRSSGGGNDGSRPSKVAKHKRTWSMSSANSNSGRNPAEDDLHSKLSALQEMFSSSQSFSNLFLRGEAEDDPDLHPVRLTGEPSDLTKVEPVEASAVWDKQSVHSSTMVSPTPSNQSLTLGRRDSHLQRFGPPSRVSSNEWKGQQQTAPVDLQASNPQHLASPPDQPVKIGTQSPHDGTQSGWIEAFGVDASYQSPTERAVKPVACFYIQPRIAGEPSKDNLYRAVYLMQRTVKDFVSATAGKCGIEPSQVSRTIRVSRKGLHILIDDQAMLEMPEGQDMTAEFSPVDVQMDSETSVLLEKPTAGYELKLLY